MPTLPKGAHIIGGRSAAEVHKTEAREFYAEIAPTVVRLAGEGLSLRQIGAELDRLGIQPRRGDLWSAAQVRRAVARCSEPEAKAPAVTGSPVKVQAASALPVSIPEEEPASQPSLPPTAKIMLSLKGKVAGPYSEPQIDEMLRTGEISLVTPFRLVDGKGWMPLMNMDRTAKQNAADLVKP